MTGTATYVNPFQSTLSMRRATQTCFPAQPLQPISIHALHEESDAHGAQAAHFEIISIHALHEESDW